MQSATAPTETASQALQAPVAPAPLARMGMMEHLAELRVRLLWTLGFLAATGLLAFQFAKELFGLLLYPLHTLPSFRMVVLTPLEMMLTYLKLALTTGIMATVPFALWQLYSFAAPGLLPQEKRYVMPFVLLGAAFFAGGVAFCFFGVLPASMGYLADMVPLGVEATYSVSSYFSLILQLMLAFGVVFELPLIMTMLAALRLTSVQSFKSFRKYWLVLAALIGGILTPTPDPLTQMMMAVPLVLFYELGILGARLCARR